MASELLRESPTDRSGSRCRSNRLSPPHTSSHKYSSVNTRPQISEVALSCQESLCENHTDRFSHKACGEGALLARRGNTLMLKIVASIRMSCSYVVSLTFVPVHWPGDRFGQFRARGVAHDSCELWLSIHLPADAPVGKYHVHISLSLTGRVEALTYFHQQPVVVLFNPWSPDDASYLEDENLLKDYVLSDVGDIYRGTVHKKELLKWEYGQFEDCCLDVALCLLRSLSADDCRSPVRVARAVVSHVSRRDGRGVVIEVIPGTSGHGGTHPCRWNGSTVILQKFHRTGAPVRYGQCWVLAGVCVSLLRALGLASRPVTCYNAAHVCSKLGQVDKHFTTDGELLDDSTGDRIWVYHVWAEVWMRRPDLVPGYDGWQVVDSALQSRCSGKYGIGPVPVVALKQRKARERGCHGGEFILAEVTADVRYLRVQSTGLNRPTSVAQVRHDETGLEIVTMATDEHGSVCLSTITDQYRDPSHVTDHAPLHFPSPAKDCTFSLSADEACIGEPIHIHITIANGGAMLRTIDGRVLGHVIHYHGQVAQQFMSMRFSGVISPSAGNRATVNLPIAAKSYMPMLVEQCMLQFFVAIKVRESQQLFLKTHPFQLWLPRIGIDCPSRMVCGATARVKLKFKNVLRCSLSRVVFLVQAGRLCPQRELASKRIVMPGQTVCVELNLRATCPHGKYTLTASLHSDLITDIHGHTYIDVFENEDLT